ncbi:MAG: hypothetical protein CSB01_04035 [Bacteroidia bacterium]|nr:MAG: hypothetical protein CSB01_04035 [Bacteroidia bacterium]
MKVFETEHDDIVMKLKDLKNILIKYMVSPKRTLQYYAIIQELFKLEEDVEYHTRIEDKILIPRVVFMEKELAKKIQ